MSCSDEDLHVEGSNHHEAPHSVEDSRVVQRLQEYCQRLEQGEQPDRQRLLAEFPEIGRELEECLDSLEFFCQVSPDLRSSDEDCPGSLTGEVDTPSLKRFGDFQILRPLGRGGMGVVYEAEQISLARRVALKVLPFVGVLDRRQLQRFQNEARCAASLDHPNIVSVYAVGCERGVHYYVMKYVEGRSLDHVIKELRDGSGAGDAVIDQDDAVGPTRPYETPRAVSADSHVASREGHHVDAPISATAAQESGRRQAVLTESRTRSEPFPDTSRTASTHGGSPVKKQHRPHARASGNGSQFNSEFFRWAADLGVQAAEGLEHAHQMGIVHRDIKPANLIIDGAGDLRITDFGLALTAQTADATLTGEIVGTLRYMSPEQLSGHRRVLDHRTDIYSLGVTLYELVTLAPAFDSDSRQELMRKIAEEGPRPPCRVNRSVPRDLETIVLKSMAKEPADRYASARDLADDLKRFCANRPIKAGRPSVAERTRRFLQRHSSAVWTTAAILLLAVIGLSVSTGLIWAKGEETARALLLVETRDRDLSLSLARETAARKLAEQNEARANEEKKRLYKNFVALNHATNGLSVLGESLLASGQTENAERLFRGLVGLWETSYRISEGGIRDSDAISLIDAYGKLSRQLEAQAKFEEAKATWHKAIAVSEEQTLECARDKKTEGLCSYFDWEAARAQTSMGTLLIGLGQLEEAEKACRNAINLLGRNPNKPWPDSNFETRFYAYCFLEEVLWAAGRRDEAKTAHREVLQLWKQMPTYFQPGYDDKECLAWCLAICPDQELCDPQEAVKLAREAVAALPASGFLQEYERWLYWKTLGVSLYRIGDWQAATEALTKSIELHSLPLRGDPVDRLFLAMAQWQLGKQEEARRLYGEAVEWMEANKPKDPELRRFSEEAARLIAPEESKEGMGAN